MQMRIPFILGTSKSLVTQGHTLKMTSQQMLLLMVQKSETFNHRLDGAKTLQIMGFQLPLPQLVSKNRILSIKVQ